MVSRSKTIADDVSSGFRGLQVERPGCFQRYFQSFQGIREPFTKASEGLRWLFLAAFGASMRARGECQINCKAFREGEVSLGFREFQRAHFKD